MPATSQRESTQLRGVVIEKVEGKNAQAAILEELKAVSEKISERALERCKRRGGDGMAIEDWIKAERELLLFPEFELIEKDSRFEVNIKASDFKPRDVRVTVLPDALIVKASSTYKHEKRGGNLRLSGPSPKILLRRFELPGQVNVDTVTANLDGGLLRLTAFRATSEAAPVAQPKAA